MGFQKGLGRLGRKRADEAVVRVRQIEGHEVRLLLHAGNHHQSFTEVRLRLAWRMGQRDEHLLAADLRRAHVVLHDRVAAAYSRARPAAARRSAWPCAAASSAVACRPPGSRRSRPATGPASAVSPASAADSPGGTEYSSILLTVLRASPNSRATARRLLPSTRHRPPHPCV